MEEERTKIRDEQMDSLRSLFDIRNRILHETAEQLVEKKRAGCVCVARKEDGG